jgi:hypothetical protein
MTEEELYKRIEFLQEQLEDKQHQIDDAKRIAGDVVSALSNAIEQGQQLHIGIVLGQSIKELQELQYS